MFVKILEKKISSPSLYEHNPNTHFNSRSVLHQLIGYWLQTPRNLMNNQAGIVQDKITQAEETLLTMTSELTQAERDIVILGKETGSWITAVPNIFSGTGLSKDEF